MQRKRVLYVDKSKGINNIEYGLSYIEEAKKFISLSKEKQIGTDRLLRIFAKTFKKSMDKILNAR